jgi:predicted RecB family nuclease
MPADTYARFYVHPQLQHDDTYKDVVYVEIFIKGDKNTSFSRPMKEEDKTMYPNGWNAFKDQDFELSDGTPLQAIPGMSPSAMIELKSTGINTVEDLAELSDGVVLGHPGMVTLRKRAQAYIAASEVEKEPEVADDPVDVEQMKNDPDVIPAKKRGRPRKVA